MKRRIAKRIILSLNESDVNKTKLNHSINSIFKAYRILGMNYVGSKFGIGKISLLSGYYLLGDSENSVHVKFAKPVVVIERVSLPMIDLGKSRYSEAPLNSEFYRTIKFGDLNNQITKDDK